MVLLTNWLVQPGFAERTASRACRVNVTKIGTVVVNCGCRARNDGIAKSEESHRKPNNQMIPKHISRKKRADDSYICSRAIN